MNSKIDNFLFEEESSTLDFKKEQYPFDKADDEQKSELLKDILAFANAWRRTDALILTGVEEIKGGKSIVIGIDKDLDDAKLQQFVNSKTQRPITFEYKSIPYENKKVGVIRIPIQSRPIYLKRAFGKLKANVVYIRRGSSTEEAKPDEIARMGAVSPEIYQIQPQIQIEFAKNKGHIRLGSELEIDIVKLLIPPRKEIPKCEKPKQGFFANSIGFSIIDRRISKAIVKVKKGGDQTVGCSHAESTGKPPSSRFRPPTHPSARPEYPVGHWPSCS